MKCEDTFTLNKKAVRLAICLPVHKKLAEYYGYDAEKVDIEEVRQKCIKVFNEFSDKLYESGMVMEY